MDVEARLEALGLRLPVPPRPVANYVPAVQIGGLVFTSGVLPVREGQIAMVGKLGKELSVEQGQDAARLALLNALSVVKQELGSLNRVARVVRLTGHVASSAGFTQQPVVLNGASDLLVAVFGEAGRHTRVAVGAAELPLGAPIEIELIIEVKS